MDVEWVILADFAEVIGNKLYLQGGAWDKLTINSGMPVTRAVGIAASIVVPWNETNQNATIEIDVATEDGESIASIKAEFRVGRPADIPAGQNQRTQIAGNLPLTLPAAGTYSLVAKLDGEERARTWFNVVEGPMLKMRQQGGQQAAQG